MKAAIISKYGGPEVMEVTDISDPEILPGHALVEVHAAAVNPFDWKLQQGMMQSMLPLKFPKIMGLDFSGVVVREAEGDTELKRGDAVFGQADLFGGSGAFAQLALARPQDISRKPRSADYVTAAALPLAGVSAVQVLLEHMKLSRGQKVLIHGGAGGIGSFTVQLAHFLGAYTAATSSALDLAFVKELGADEAIDYKKDKFEAIVKDFDAVFDTVGADTYTRSFQVLKPGGIIVSMLEQPNEELMRKFSIAAVAQQTKVTRERLSRLADFVEQGAIKVQVDKVFQLKDAAAALDYLKNSHSRGKVVIAVR